MSIEQALAENTSAIRELIAALRAGIPTTAAQVAAVADEAPALAQPEATPATEAPAAVSDAAEHGKTAAQAVKALDGHANKPAPAATYENARAAMLSLSKEKGRDAVVAVLSAFGVQKLPDLEPEHYDALVAKVEEARA
jgi:hypothetical protein